MDATVNIASMQEVVVSEEFGLGLPNDVSLCFQGDQAGITLEMGYKQCEKLYLALKPYFEVAE